MAAGVEILPAALMTAVLGTYYFKRKKTDRTKALACKAAATAMPGAVRVLQAVRGAEPDLQTGLTLAAVVFYLAADVLLECRFVLGAVSFGIGHVCMTAGLLSGGSDSGFFAAAAAAFWVYMAGAYLGLRTYFAHLMAKKLLFPAAAYVALLSLMAACALAAGLREGGIRGAALAAGGVCFVVSDLLLGQNRLGRRRSRKKGAAVLVLYYLAVWLLVVS